MDKRLAWQWRRRLALPFALLMAVATSLWIAAASAPAHAQTSGALGLDLIGVVDGTAPFDSDSTAGNDSSATNLQVRTHDTVSWTWRIGLTGRGANPAPTDVVLVQTIGSLDGAVAGIDAIPATCRTGTNPATGLPYLPQSSLSATELTCNVGRLANNATLAVTVTASVSGASPDGSTIESTQSVRGFDAAGTETTARAIYANDAATTVTARAEPRFDLDVERRPWVAGVEFHDGELGYRVVYYTSVRTIGDRGVEQLPNTFGWTATLDTAVAGQVPNARILNTTDNCKRISDTQATFPDGAGGGATRVTHSGTMTCSQSAHGAPVAVSISGADTTGDHYPTTAPLNLFGFPSYVNGPYYVGTYLSQWFVPLRDITAVGSVDLVFCLSDFDPNSMSGRSNFGAGFEPGWNGTAPSGDNCTAITTLTTNLSFENDTRFLTTTAVGGGFLCCDPTFYVPTQTNGRTGDGTVEPGDRFMAMQPMHNTGTEAVSHFVSCLTIDNSVLRAAPIDPGPNPWAGSNEVGRLSLMATAELDAASYVLEYASGRNDGTVGGWNNDVLATGPSATGSYAGDFTNQQAATCDDADADSMWGWTPQTALDAPAGIPLDQITKVRVRLVDPAGYQVPGGAIVRPRLGLESRATFFGGPHDGEPIPAGALLATMSRWRVAELNGGDWSTPNYDPNSHGGLAGDRLEQATSSAPSAPPTTTIPPATTTTTTTTTRPIDTTTTPSTTTSVPTTTLAPTTTGAADHTTVPGAGVGDSTDDRGPSGPLALTGDDAKKQLQGAVSLILIGALVLVLARLSRREPTDPQRRRSK